jgi:hypothetical protein
MAGIYPLRRSIKVFCFFSSEKKDFALPYDKARHWAGRQMCRSAQSFIKDTR